MQSAKPVAEVIVCTSFSLFILFKFHNIFWQRIFGGSWANDYRKWQAHNSYSLLWATFSCFPELYQRIFAKLFFYPGTWLYWIFCSKAYKTSNSKKLCFLKDVVLKQACTLYGNIRKTGRNISCEILFLWHILGQFYRLMLSLLTKCLMLLPTTIFV